MLRRGITGLSEVGDIRPAPGFGFEDFKTVVYSAARAIGGRVAEARPAGITPNFYQALVELTTERLSVLCNSVFPVIAFCEPIPEGKCKTVFRDCPKLAAAIAKLGSWEIASAAQLDAPVSREELAQLAPYEQKGVKYWRCRSIGRIIFNWFD
jgi:hypothetical protein